MTLRLVTSPALPSANLWQSLGWARFQQALGREARWYAWQQGSETRIEGLVIIDRTWRGFSTWDLPRGPTLQPETSAAEVQGFLQALATTARQERALSLTWSGVDARLQTVPGTCASGRHEQPEASLILDLTLGEEALLAQMHQKGRYNIRLADRHGVQVEQSADVGAYAALAQQTAQRDGFQGPRQRQFELFLRHVPGAFLLLAFHPSHPTALAGLIGVVHDQAAIYYYGASASAGRELMAPYALQWAAMRQAKALGATSYDLLGIAPPGTGPMHPWAGISDFKRKFGGTLVTYLPERQITLRPLTHAALQAKRRWLG